MGLSFETTGKYTSERHEAALRNGKYTAGQASQKLRKSGVKIYAKELVEAFKVLHGREPEWHHSGFYKKSSGATMGRTFFFSESQLEELETRMPEVKLLLKEIEAEELAKAETKIQGFYWVWESDYLGRYGKKRNYKVLKIYEGNELNKPKNFVSCNNRIFENVKEKEGTQYFGWDEPKLHQFA